MCLSKLKMKFIKFCIMGARTKAWRNDLLRVINFAKCICLNCKINLFKLQNVFAQIVKYEIHEVLYYGGKNSGQEG